MGSGPVRFAGQHSAQDTLAATRQQNLIARKPGRAPVAPASTPLGIYVHIPFCRSKCTYCHFVSLSGTDADTRELYVRHVCDEIRLKATGEPVDTIYLGGGTPTLLTPEQIARILAAARSGFHVTSTAEISVEANPESVDLHALGSLCAAGVNRISIGVQSLNDDALKSLGRSHTADQARHAIAIAREGGFSNVSADLMFGLPGQDLAEWRACLEEAFLLPIEHLSCYELCADPAAAFAHPEPGWPSEDETADQWELLMDMADANGFEHYEVANYARPGFACRHNLKYWRDTDFIGIGTGAWSSRDGIRSANLHDLTQYFAGSSRGYPPAEEIRPGSGARMAETLMLNLRLREGASEAGFSRRYGPRALDVFMPALSAHLKAGRLERGNGCIRLTRPGLLLANEVWADLLEAGKA